MDQLNRQILSVLEANARTPFAQIGKAIGLSAPAVGQRVRQMEEEEIIEGYFTKINPDKVGVTLKAFITIRIVFGQMRRLKAKLSELEEIKSSYRITGEDCMLLLGHFKHNQHLVATLDQLTEFGQTQTNIILEEIGPRLPG